ncbi:hypothetical protein [uncultured Sunxiuqinia sp.]|uniref:hypothetical protein n=1 Tax=uncultured Sunxiuqinia sp. TaxID=1573825 RepID=UPI002AA8D642|nr:hypothetical protein [uncultured Sunxiuqinia sp.]
MKAKFDISRRFIVRLLLFVLVIGGAYIFDRCHDQLPEQHADQQQDASKHHVNMSQMFVYNSVSSYKIRSGNNCLVSKILFTIGNDKFLAAFHNRKTFHVLKAESLKERSPQNLMVHFRKFMICHHFSSDDTPYIA